ncbi:MAG: glycosyltransferase family 4 protein [Chitinophagaceae bacterium]|nr:glycosyltransferase family 4 protein [Chitinophagaceae bacterium]
MKNYLVDLHRLRHNPYNGLYTFSCRLAEHLLLQPLHNEQFAYYLPKDKFGLFGAKPKYVAHKRSHKHYQSGTGKYDVWHLTTGISQYRPFNRKTKVVYTIHDVNFLVEDPDNKKRNKRSLKLMQHNADRADHIVGISKYALDFAGQHLNFGKTPTSVIYNGYTVSEFPGFDEPNYRPARQFLFSLSLVQPRKNFHVLPSLLVGNDYELIIAGLNNFEYADTVRSEAARWNVADRVKLIGPVDEKNKYWYYKNCSAFMFPSLAEGFGAPPLEAMHFGKPVFLSDKMSLPEVGGDVAHYFTDFDPEAMRSVFDNGMKDHEANGRAEAIEQQATHFNWNTNAQKYLDIYRNLSQ